MTNTKNKKQNKEAEDISELFNFNFKINWGYVVILGIILILIGSFYMGIKFSKQSHPTTINYNGITFNKTMENNIPFYNVLIPIIDSNGKILGYRSIDFRSDPRTLANITFEKQTDIKFSLNRTVFISYDELKLCPDNAVAAVNFYLFLTKFGFTPDAGLMNKTSANESRLDYITCENSPHNTVIEVINGNETKVIEKAKNCYQIVSNNCEIVRAMEKFELQTIEEYFNRITQTN